MIVIDFETYSPVDLTKASSYKYMHNASTDIVCLAYKIHDDPTVTWTPQVQGGHIQLLFDYVEAGEKIFAHNALFDYLAWNIIGSRYGFPELRLEQCVDTQALASRYTLPGSLEKVGVVLDLGIQKNKAGAGLMRKISMPTRNGKRPVQGVDYSHTDYVDYLQYCKDDVNATDLLVRSLPASELSEDEQRYWDITQRMNMAGLPVDESSAVRILDYISSFAEEMTLRVPELSQGAIQKVTQVAKLKAWMLTKGVKVENLQAATVEALLKDKNLPGQVREMLELRQTIGRSSTAKYRKIADMVIHGRVYNNLQYYGTSTGRWAGRGFQLQNLPRASVPNPDDTISKFNNFEPVDDPVNVAKALIRPMIKAPEGRMLIVSDYSSIENRLLAWVAKDEPALELFRTGGDQYVDMASFLYRKGAEDITKSERQIGKIIILGCGYGMGAKRFVETAATWGVHMELHEAQRAVDAYRDRYSLVKTMWYKLKDACVQAIQRPGETYECNSCSFRVVKCRADNRWLVLRLPSGRNLYYMAPYLSEDTYGLVPGHYGINPYTKKWDRLKLIPGRVTENIVQALARDIMAHGLVKVTDLMADVILLGTVHDEAIGEISAEDDNRSTMLRFNNCLCMLPDWATGLPLEAEGYIAERYRK